MTRDLAMLAALLALVTLAACGDRTTGPDAAPRIELHVVPLPATVTAARFPWYASGGDAILFSGVLPESARDELLAIREDGSGFRCLTCGVAPEVEAPLLKPFAFPDGRRVLLRVGEQSPVQAANHAVLECSPSVADCARAELVPIVVPVDEHAVVRQDQRELRVGPDGRHVGFTQVRTTATGEGALVAIVARLERDGAAYELRDARVVSRRGELKGFTPDGAAVLVADFTTAYEAANPDVVRVELASGAESRVTSYPDYDEPLELSPDQRWYVVGSGRTSGLLETAAQPSRPNFIGPGLEPLVAALFVTRRSSLIQPWLVRAGEESASQPGVQLNAGSAAEGYSGRAIPNWHPDGTRIVFWEGTSDASRPPTSATRIVVVRLAGIAPSRPDGERATPDSPWAPPLVGFVPPDTPPARSRPGLHGGSVEIAHGERADGTKTLEVVYRGFSDDGASLLDGFERAEYTGGLTGGTRYTADLRVSGRHDGFLVADAHITPAGIEGSIESEVDGRRLRLPPPAP